MGHLPVRLHISLQLVLANGLVIVLGTKVLNPIQYAPPNFVVSSSITIKFGVVREFDKFSPKQQKSLKNDVTEEL